MGLLLSGALLDTSVVINGLGPRQMDAPETMAISVITLGELRAGVRLAGDPSARAARQRRLVAIRDAFEPIPVDETVAEHYGDVLATARSAGRATKATDLLIIATAAATGRILHTLDTRQTALAQAAGIQVRSNA
ncbi:MAG TPA: PIN domain-containing protein [Solirubrobacteraceae bacterium]|nr:PIN domain-containing protein [Solirubrobacteraceae bacterium]